MTDHGWVLWLTATHLGHLSPSPLEYKYRQVFRYLSLTSDGSSALLLLLQPTCSPRLPYLLPSSPRALVRPLPLRTSGTPRSPLQLLALSGLPGRLSWLLGMWFLAQ